MKFFLITLKLTVIIIEGIVAFIVFYFTLFLIGSFIQIGHLSENKSGTILIGMKSDGIHTDLVLPVQSNVINWRSYFHPADTRLKDTTKQLISIGWGDQGFFLNTPTWADLTASTAFRAAFYLSKSAIHINYLNENEISVEYKSFRITKQQYQRLISYIQKSIPNQNTHTVLIANKGYWDNDAFYQANGSYGLWNTCNSWVNGALKNADLPAAMWTPFNHGIFGKYRN